MAGAEECRIKEVNAVVKAHGRDDNGMVNGKNQKKKHKRGGLEVNTAGILYIRGI